MERTQPDQPTEAPSLDAILTGAAILLEAINPDTAMSAGALLTQVQLSVWQQHGIYANTEATTADRDTALAAARHLPLTGTRAEFAARLRLDLKTVSL